MKESMRKLLCITAAATLIGCASSGPVQIGKDTYIITKTSAGGAFVSGASVKTELIQEDIAFCQKSGKTLELISGEGKNAIPFGGPHRLKSRLSAYKSDKSSWK
jgi:hypothetical protein